MHAKNYFTDALHRKIADKVSTKTYDCARCHMPMADNMDALITGEARPDKNNKTHTDAVSCYFCHTIAYVKTAHKFNINTKSKQAADYKPTLYGRLNNPDENDKHSSVNNPIYAQKVCMGCHSHKLNDNNVTVFRAMKKGQDSLSCIKCHMPKVEGGAEKMDKRARGHHISHKFLGIHDKAFRQTGVDLNVSVEGQTLHVDLTNKMAHPLIVQPARAKFIKVTIRRNGKIIWQNYRKDPKEDNEGYFSYNFSKDGHPVVIPAEVTQGEMHNIAAKETKRVLYTVPVLKKGDVIRAALYVQLAKSDCEREIDLGDSLLSTPQLMKEVKVVLP